jgi:ribose transport system ATP-binding protein
VGTVSATAERATLVRMMVGRELAEQFPRAEIERSGSVLSLSGLTGTGFDDVSLDVAGGETIGIFGNTGCGSRELIRSLFGLVPHRRGEIRVRDSVVTITSPHRAIEAGLAFISDDRKVEGLLLSRTIRENISAPILARLTSFGRIRRREENRLAGEYAKSLDIRTPTIEQLARNLSGGNQQKVVLAKWLSAGPRVFLLHEPTRGVDVGAKAEIYRLINRLKSEGAAVLVASSELTELIGISDRLFVMYRGRIAAEFDPRHPRTTQGAVLHAASGTAADVEE